MQPLTLKALKKAPVWTSVISLLSHLCINDLEVNASRFRPSNKIFRISEFDKLEDNFIEENSSFAIYPNPATNNLNIIYDELKKTILTIYDVSGRLLLKKELNNKGFNSQSIDISSFDKGVYLVQINQNGIIKSERLIIE